MPQPTAENAAQPSQPPLREAQEGDVINGFYILKESSLRETRKGSHYIRLTLADAHAELHGNVWDKTEEQYLDVQEQYRDLLGSSLVKVRAAVESYRDNLQLKILRLRPASADEADLDTLLPKTPCDVSSLMAEIRGLFDSMDDADYRALASLFLEDEDFCDRLVGAAAARTNHHAYRGGLLEHTASLMRICSEYARQAPSLRRDLLLMGAFFHDIGKLEEMRTEITVEYTDAGSLLGHLCLGVLMIEDRLRQLPDFPREKRDLIYHLILSHHGRHEYGSPVLPAIPEAFALHHVDNLDAKVFAAHRIISEDPNETSRWTERSWMLETRLFKG